jgi:uncharacterized protein YgbK (DUF1537 family)
MQRWLILADDLTGAADAGVAFARRGWHTHVIWGEAVMPADAQVCAFDTDSRGRSAAVAAERHRQAVRRLLKPGWKLYKKIDSTLRGHPAEEVAGLCAELREMRLPAAALVAPSNPAMGRTLRDGRLFLHGRPLDELREWTTAGVASADLGEMLSAARLHVVKLPLAVVRGAMDGLADALHQAAARATEGAGVVVLCDAETEQDLARLVAASPGIGLYVGSGGLAQALAAHRPVQNEPPRLEPTRRGTLIAIGTRAAVSHAAAAELAAHLGREPVHIAIGADPPALDIAARLERGEDTVVRLRIDDSPENAPESAYCRHLSQALQPALHAMGALIVTGGETAATLLSRCEVDGIRLLDEVEPGVALGMTCGAVRVPIVTKPGAFGNEQTLVRCLEKLRTLRRTT